MGSGTFDAAADAFFGRQVTPELRARVLAEAGTPLVLLRRWERDCARARAVDRQMTREVRARERAESQRRAAAERARMEQARATSRERARVWAAQHPRDTTVRGRRWAQAHPERRRQINHDYYVRNRDAIAARARERRRLDPDGQAKWSRAYRASHREEISQKQRATRADPDVKRRHAAYNRDWGHRERRRIKAGLPPRRIYRLSPTELRAADAEADEFFARAYTPAQLKNIRDQHGQATPPELLAGWRAECAAARRACRIAESMATEIPRLPESERTSEELRMDTIAKVINERLRRATGRRDPFHESPAAPHAAVGIASGRGVDR